MNAILIMYLEQTKRIVAILWNAVTSPDTVLNGNLLKTKLYNPILPYIIVLASSVKILEIKAIEFHRMDTIISADLSGVKANTISWHNDVWLLL